MRSILLLPLVARCLEKIDVCIWRMFVFMSVVVTVWGSVGIFCCVVAVLEDSVLAWSCRCSCMGSMSVSSCRCCMFVSCVHSPMLSYASLKVDPVLSNNASCVAIHKYLRR